MNDSRLFEGLDLEERTVLGARCKTHKFEDGERILDLGVPNESLFVVVSGSASVERAGHGENLEVVRIGAGDMFGEVVEVTKGAISALTEERARLAAKLRRNVSVALEEQKVLRETPEAEQLLGIDL